jgi:hypothetical protein
MVSLEQCTSSLQEHLTYPIDFIGPETKASLIPFRPFPIAIIRPPKNFSSFKPISPTPKSELNCRKNDVRQCGEQLVNLKREDWRLPFDANRCIGNIDVLEITDVGMKTGKIVKTRDPNKSDAKPGVGSCSTTRVSIVQSDVRAHMWESR